MILSVTTLKDSLANVRTFVSRNLNAGVDHLVIYLDAESPEVEEFLTAHPDVTCVAAYGDWWEERPPNLNRRQATHAGLLGRLLDGYDWAEWLVHIDGDEVAWLDREALAAVGSEHQAVRLSPWEAVAQMHASAAPVVFKRLLSTDELALVHLLGLIDKPSNRSYFRGHMAGKLAVRPSIDRSLAIHKLLTADDEKVEAHDDGRQHLLHYESYDGDEFVRKWVALLTSGNRIRQLGARASLAQAIEALLALQLGEAETAHFLRQIYERHAVDDVATLDGLGLLVHVDADAPRSPREPFPESAKEDLRALFDRIRSEPKRPFRPYAPAESAVRAARRVQRDVGKR